MADENEIDLEKPSRQVTTGILKGIRDFIVEWWYGKSESGTPGRSVLIIGPGGVGKTSFAQFLSGHLTLLDDGAGEYDESLTTERFTLTGEPETELVVAPGQDFRRPTEWPELKSQLAAGEYRGVILVGAYGYHDLSTQSYKNHQLYKGSVDRFRTDYFAERRAEELRVLRELVPQLALCPMKVWLLSLITKQDLWDKVSAEVEEHYARGEYAETVADAERARGAARFRHEIVYASLILRNLKTLNDETIANTVAGYDHPRQVASFVNLVRVLEALRGWEDVT